MMRTFTPRLAAEIKCVVAVVSVSSYIVISIVLVAWSMRL